ncbi:MAG: 4Fe-4S dicluster domain-containing protein [Acidimicrobiales bacterium]|jgi:quinone-modifying oxidoreductase subunit QmoC
MGSKGATLPKADASEFGWLWHGKPVRLLADRSFDLAAARAHGAFLEPYCLDVATLKSCLQCGACTATCDLAGEEGLFPRRQVTFVRLGLQERLAAEKDVWHCYGCTDCSAKCPSGAKPASIMSALRHFATDRYAYPQVVARVVNSKRYFWLVYIATAALLAVIVAATGAFSPGPGPLRYAGMIPDAALIPIFSFLTLLPLLAIGVGATRAWQAWYGDSLSPMRPRILGRSARRAITEIVAHRRFASCKERRLRPWAHRSVLFSFLGLAMISGVMALLLAIGRPYPLPMDNPLKVLGNLFAALLIGGTIYFLLVRITEASRGTRSTFFEWAFLVNVLLAGVTGVATEIVRVADVRAWSYPVYFVHLVVVLVLALTLPYTKLAHAVYRLLAVVGREYEVLLADDVSLAGLAWSQGSGEGDTSPREVPHLSQEDPAPRAPVPEKLLGLGHRELASYSDDEIAAAYYALRDEAEPRGEAKYYPNLKRLFGTAFEREKDRREVRALVASPDKTEWQTFYEEAAERSCTWWLENHLVARRALTSCLSCGMCTSVCPAAEHFEEYDPRCIVDAALSGDEERLVELLKSDILWYCAQCGSCNSRCPHNNDIMGLVGSLRCLAQLKGYHVESVRGRQQYAGRHLWGANLWNRAVSLYFRNGDPAAHPDFGPRYARWQAELEEQFIRVGGQPDMDGTFAGRKVTEETLAELRGCIRAGGALFLWDRIEQHAARDAARLGLDIDQYHDKVRSEG